jgi:hypothetical protein
VFQADGTTISDVMRFTDAAGDLTGSTADRMYFYSGDSGGGELADSGLPNSFLVTQGESVNENAIGSFTWSPAPNTYVGQSPNRLSRVPCYCWVAD